MSAPRSVAIRPFRAGDLPGLVALMRETVGVAVEAGVFVRDFLLAPGFAPDHVLMAEAGGDAVGFVLAPRRDAAGAGDAGWIAGFGVAPSLRGQGVGTQLLDAALAGMRRDGVVRVDVADVPVRYVLPGVDREAFPEAFRLLTGRFGFAVRDDVASMGIGLAGWSAPPSVPSIRACLPGEFPWLRDFLLREFDPGWWAFFEQSIRARLSGNPEPFGVICHFEDGVPAGVVHYRANRFGPLAVSARLRGRGIGEALTRAALAGMRAQGFGDAHFMIGAVDVQGFYARLGFRVLRRFTRLTLSL